MAQSKGELCSNEFDDSFIKEVLSDLDSLENYYIKNGVLSDSSGRSYREVFEKIYKNGDIKVSLEDGYNSLRHYIDNDLYRQCFYLLLEDDELAQLNESHLVAARNIIETEHEDISPKKTAKRIIDNLSVEDFDMKFFKYSTLVTLYQLSLASTKISLHWSIDVINEATKTVDVEIRAVFTIDEKNNKIRFNGDIIDEVTIVPLLNTFYLENENISNKGIEVQTSRDTPFSIYLSLMEEIKLAIRQLREDSSRKLFNIGFKELNAADRKTVEDKYPMNIVTTMLE